MLFDMRGTSRRYIGIGMAEIIMKEREKAKIAIKSSDTFTLFVALP